MNEATVTSYIRLNAAQLGINLWRNNSGGFYDEKGRFVRYGLGSFIESQQLASSDYIGITPLFVMPEHVGQVLGIFTAIEIKTPDWKFNKNDKRSVNQQNFINLVLKNGGYAGFAPTLEDFKRIVKNV